MTTLFLNNPRLLVVTIVLIIAAGVSSLVTIGRQEDPTITNYGAVIVTPFPGASAERVEALVTNKIEDELREITEVDIVTSVSRNGVSVVVIEVSQSLDEDQVAEIFSRMRDRLEDANGRFPEGAGKPIFDDKRGESNTLIVALSWTLDTPPRDSILNRFAEELQNQLRRVPNTKMVTVLGVGDEEIAVNFNADELAAAGLTTVQVADAIRGADAKVTAGVVRSANSNTIIEVTGELDSLERIRQVPITIEASGAMLQVGDIAEVRRTVHKPQADFAFRNGKPAVVVAARQSPGHRFDHWSHEADAILEAFKAELPAGLELEVMFDQSRYTRTQLETLVTNVIVGLVLVVAVLFVTLGWRSTLIVGVTLPLVSCVSLAMLGLLGVPIHQTSVTGLIVALGLLVDNAIVIVDAVQVKRMRGAPASVAVRQSLHHLWIPLLSSTLTTALAFLPIVLIPGQTGEFVGAVGLSVIVSVVSSYFIGMTIVATLAGRFLRAETDEHAAFWRNGIRLPRLGRAFARSIDWSLRSPKLSLVLASTLPVLGFVAGGHLKAQLFPAAERDLLNIEVRLPEQASIEATVAVVRTIDGVLRRHDEVKSIDWFVGRSAPPFYYNLKDEEDGTPSYAQAHLRLATIGDVEKIAPVLQRELDVAVPEAQVLVRELIQGPPVDSPLEIRVYGTDIEVLRKIGDQVRERMSRMANVTHTQCTLSSGSPRVRLRADEAEIALAGLRLVDVAQQLNVHLEGMVAGSVVEGTHEIPVRVRVGDETRASLNLISSTSLLPRVGPGTDGIPLSSLVQPELAPMVSSIPHRNGQRVNTVRGYTRVGVFPETAVAELRDLLAKDPIELPLRYRLEFGGEEEQRGDAMGGLIATAPVLIVLMIATVVLAIGSFRLAGVIFLVGLQSVGLGFLSLYLFGHPLGLMSLFGLIGLVGIAINAAIIINSALCANRDSVQGSPEAIRDVVVTETSRHIFSTTITTFGGFLPLILSEGRFWPPFATGIAGGVLLSTIASFYFVPAFFLILTRRRALPVSPEQDETFNYPTGARDPWR